MPTLASAERSAQLKALSRDWPSVVLDEAELCALELWLTGAVANAPLALPGAAPLALRDPEGNLLAVRAPEGGLEGLRLPLHYDNLDLRLTPAGFADGVSRMALLAACPMTAAQAERLSGTPLVIFIAAGPPGAVDPFTLVRCYRAMMPRFPEGSVRLVVLPFNAATHGPLFEEVARNYGCDGVIPFDETPGEYFPEVASELETRYPPRPRRGFTVFFTGLSGSGKSTIANILRVKILERGGRTVAMLDGDLVRRMLSSELNFSPEHRDLNIRRIGYVAAEITKAGGIAICAPIAPYARLRREVRRMVEASGGFVLVHVATAIEVCEGRDVKGLYAKARAGLIGQFTGVSDPYETPEDAELRIDTAGAAPEDSAAAVLRWLEEEGYLAAESIAPR